MEATLKCSQIFRWQGGCERKWCAANTDRKRGVLKAGDGKILAWFGELKEVPTCCSCGMIYPSEPKGTGWEQGVQPPLQWGSLLLQHLFNILGICTLNAIFHTYVQLVIQQLHSGKYWNYGWRKIFLPFSSIAKWQGHSSFSSAPSPHPEVIWTCISSFPEKYTNY